MFNEVFLTDAVVGDDARIGGLNNGWAVANTTLQCERSGLGAGGNAPARGMALVYPGTVAGHLDRRAGDFVQAPPTSRTNGQRRSGSAAKPYIDLAKSLGRIDEPAIRQDLARLHTLSELARYNTVRQKACAPPAATSPASPTSRSSPWPISCGSAATSAWSSSAPRGMLHAYDDDARKALAAEPGGVAAIMVTSQALGAQAPPIYGGTDQIQRNIIGERVLGLPKEPGDLTTRPFSELPKNA